MRGTLVIHVSGRWHLELSTSEKQEASEIVLLDTTGDYAVWDQGVHHRWRAQADFMERL